MAVPFQRDPRRHTDIELTTISPISSAPVFVSPSVAQISGFSPPRFEIKADSHLRQTFWRAILGEFLGSILLVFFGVGSAIASQSYPGVTIIAQAFGHSVSYAIISVIFSEVSGGHINPVVTTALGCANFTEPFLIPFYVSVQVAGGILGSLVRYRHNNQQDETLSQHQILWGLSPHLTRATLASTVVDPSVTAAQVCCCLQKASFHLFYLSLKQAFGLEFMGSFLIALAVCSMFDAQRKTQLLSPSVAQASLRTFTNLPSARSEQRWRCL